MGLNISCAIWEVLQKSFTGSASRAYFENADCDHYLDDYIFVSPCDTEACLSLMEQFLLFVWGKTV